MNQLLSNHLYRRKNPEKFVFRLFHTMMLLIMLLIFCFSAQNGEESSEISNAALIWILNTIGALFSREFQLWLTEWIRKVAHFSIYFSLGFFSAGMMYSRKGERSRLLLNCFLGWLIAIAYAATDEFHQIFVQGRAGRFFDVCIDGAGAMTGVMLFAAFCGGIILIRNRINRKKEAESR